MQAVILCKKSPPPPPHPALSAKVLPLSSLSFPSHHPHGDVITAEPFHSNFVLPLGYICLETPFFGTCPSKNCGQLEVTYPFCIIGQQNEYCGYPGFEDSCENGTIPLVNISGNPYAIQQIWYTSQTP